MTKPIDGRKLINDSKNKVKKQKEKENKDMKNNKKTIIATVLVTLATIATIGGLLYTGFQYGVSYEKSKSAEVQSAIKDMAATVTSKTQQ